MRLIFIRHGDPDYENDCLTELGRKEAQALAERIKDWDIDDFYVSPLGRAAETADYVLKARGEIAVTCDWLREFDAPLKKPNKNGAYGVTWDWLPSDWTGVDEYYDIDRWFETDIMRSENVKAKYDEVTDHLDELLEAYGYVRDGKIYRVRKENRKTICFVCHFGVGIVMLSHLINTSPMQLWHGMLAYPTSISEIITEEREQGIAYFRLNRYGDRAHIEAAGLPVNTSGSFTDIYSDMSERH